MRSEQIGGTPIFPNRLRQREMEQKLEDPAQRLILLDTQDILEILDHVAKLNPQDQLDKLELLSQWVQLEVDDLRILKYEKIAEQRRTAVKKWQKNNKEQVRSWQKKYAQKEKDRFVQYAKNYQIANKDKYNEYQIKYRSQLKEYNKLVKVFKQLPFQNE